MFGLNWVKPILRKRMKPIPHQKARTAVNNLSLVYAFVGWNIVTFCLYLTFKKHVPDGPEKIQKYAEIFDIDHAHVVRYSGFQKIDEYDLDRTEEIKKDPKREAKFSDLHLEPPKKLGSKNITQESSTSI